MVSLLKNGSSIRVRQALLEPSDLRHFKKALRGADPKTRRQVTNCQRVVRVVSAHAR